ncbi:MAG: hypothetical protein KIT27_11060 [Legionellales bacterium]|nr:hypothetical protein [Legionellales bacterium]
MMMLVFWMLFGFMVLSACLCVSLPLVRQVDSKQWPGYLQQKSPIVAIIATLLILSLAFVLYSKWGDNTGLKEYYTLQKNAKETQKIIAELKTPALIIAKLQAHLAQDPNSDRGWYLLGRLYFTMSNFKQAEQAFFHAHTLSPNNNDITMQYAQASYFAQGQQFKPEILEMIQTVLKNDPNNNTALNLLAIDNYHHQDYQQAIVLWEKLLQEHPPQTADGKIILDAIVKAQKQLQLLHPKTLIKIPVHVTLQDHEQKNFTPETKVFIYAQALQGPPMPLAIVQKHVKDLPLNITLDSTMAMLPNIDLNHYPNIRIIARISPSGQALPQPDDVYAISKPINTQHPISPVVLTINTVGKV